jgi:hypothetical protein
LARHDSSFEPAAEARLDPEELLAALRGEAGPDGEARREAIARCLSGSAGWRDAAAKLGGAFAGRDNGPGLTDDQDK